MKNKNGLAFVLAIAFPLMLAACEGATGPQGPAGPAGNDDTETVAEIVAASTNGDTLIDTDSEMEAAGLGDTIPLGGGSCA